MKTLRITGAALAAGVVLVAAGASARADWSRTSTRASG